MYLSFICRGGTPWPPQLRITRAAKKGRPRSAAPTNTPIVVLITIVLFSLRPIAAQQLEDTFEGYMHGIRSNAVKGEVIFQREGAKYPLDAGLKFEKGDFIKTSPNACAELLLQPGNYLRLGGDSEIQLINDEHDRMRLQLNRGTISVEILSRENINSFYSGGYEARYLIRVMTPGAGVFISEPGVFRISATPNGQTELIVRNGSAVIKGHEVKAKRRAVVTKENITISDIDSKSEDAFDAWARERADTLVRTNKALKKTTAWSKKQKDAAVDVTEEEGPGGSPLIVSAKPGTVNFAEEGVEFSRAPNEWQALTEKINLQPGDRLRTEANSFTELELFPDMHFRLAGSSEAVFDQLSNDAVSVKIVSGSAILDVARFDRKKAPQITIAGASTSVTIADSGNYRINVDAITVRDGKVIFKERSVGACHIIAGEVVSDCDKKRNDDFDYWSYYRGEGEYYNGWSMASYLAKVRRLRFRNAGFWFQYPGEMTYTFVPFTSEMYRSPYGGNYSTALSPRRRMNRSNEDSFRIDRLPSQQPSRP